MTGCLYIPHFPAWVFERIEEGAPRHPGTIVVIAGGKVVAASRAALRVGVEAGITAARARALFPPAEIRVRDRELETACWEDVIHELVGVTPFVEGMSPPFAFFRIEKNNLDEIRSLGRSLGVRVGITTCKSFAQLVAIRAATGNTLLLRRKALRGFFERFKTEWLVDLGFEEEFVELLGLFGYTTLLRIRQLSHRHMRIQFGEEGGRLFSQLHPDSESPISLYRPPDVVGASHFFETPCSEPGQLEQVLPILIDRADVQLGHRTCRRVILRLEDAFADREFKASKILIEATFERKSLLHAATHLLGQTVWSGTDIDRITLTLGSLRAREFRQSSLFRNRPSIHRVVAYVNRRYPGVIKQAVIQEGSWFTEDEFRFEPFPDKPPSARAGVRGQSSS